jgi:hypothetical protein
MSEEGSPRPAGGDAAISDAAPASPPAPGLSFVGLTGQKLIKLPGSINGCAPQAAPATRPTRRPPPAARRPPLSPPTTTSSPPHTSTRSESFTLRDLVDCDVYLLDHASEVEAAGLRGCRVFLGPVDGPAIFDNCSDCTSTARPAPRSRAARR